jgi:Clr5 domain
MEGRKTLTPYNVWDQHRCEIEQLYSQRRFTARQVLVYLKKEYGIDTT